MENLQKSFKSAPSPADKYHRRDSVPSKTCTGATQMVRGSRYSPAGPELGGQFFSPTDTVTSMSLLETAQALAEQRRQDDEQRRQERKAEQERFISQHDRMWKTLVDGLAPLNGATASRDRPMTVICSDEQIVVTVADNEVVTFTRDTHYSSGYFHRDYNMDIPPSYMPMVWAKYPGGHSHAAYSLSGMKEFMDDVAKHLSIYF